MKQRCHPPSRAGIAGRRRGTPSRLQSRGGRERGFATVIVLILVFVMIALLLGNNRVLHLLKRDLQRIEERQRLASAGRKAPTVTVPAVAPAVLTAPASEAEVEETATTDPAATP